MTGQVAARASNLTFDSRACDFRVIASVDFFVADADDPAQLGGEFLVSTVRNRPPAV